MINYYTTRGKKEKRPLDLFFFNFYSLPSAYVLCAIFDIYIIDSIFLFLCLCIILFNYLNRLSSRPVEDIMGVELLAV